MYDECETQRKQKLRILICGGLGFIGQNLVRFLVREKEYELRVLDSELMFPASVLEHLPVEYVKGDISDSLTIERAFEGVDAVINLAAHTTVKQSIIDPMTNFAVNCRGMLNLLMASKDHNIKKFIFASTGGALCGDALLPIDETLVPAPLSPYGASKACGEAYCSAFSGSFGIDATCLRFSNVYGPFSDRKQSIVASCFNSILKNQRLSIFGDGSQTRDFVYVSDICKAIDLALLGRGGYQVYQLGSGVETSVNELVRIVQEIVNEEGQLLVNYEEKRQGEVARNFADISHATAGLGFEPEVELTEGLRETWRWFRSLR